MARRLALAEAKSCGKHAAEMGRHGPRALRTRHSAPSLVTRMPPQYSTRDVELLLEAIWAMFTQSQAQRLVVSVPWDDSEEPRQIVLADLAAMLESWLS